MDRYDVIAIGGGSAGLVTAAGAAGLGARVALVEQHRLGGECLWTGCVPSKALLAAARAAAQVRRAPQFGIRVGPPETDFAAVMRWVRQAQDRIAPHDSPERFRGLGVAVVEGVARFVAERELEVNGRRLHGRHIVIATGSRPAIPDLPGLDQVPYHTNETIFTIDAQPRRLLVLGAGPIGLELAQAFARLGSEVTVIEAADRLLPREDRELADLLGENIRAEGVELLLGEKATAVARAASGLQLSLASGRRIDGDVLLIATGRKPNHDALELGQAGVAVEANGIHVDRRLRTSTRGVWAAGDVTGAPRFTHVADYQARLVLRNALFPFSTKASYTKVPWVTFTDPELAHVGLTEEEARARHGDDIRVWRRSFDDVDRAVADGERTGLVKLIADSRGRLLGGHVLGYLASSLIGEIALALQHKIGIARIAHTVHAYPTYPEAIRQAAEGQIRARLKGRTRQLIRWWVRAQ